MCGQMQLGCHVREGMTNFVADRLHGLTQEVGKAAESGLQSIATFWMRIDSPELGRTQAGDTFTNAAPVQFLRDYSAFIVFAMATVAVVIGGARMAWESRGEPARELLRSLLTLIVVAGAGTWVVQLLAQGGDAFALWVVEKSLPHNESFQTALGNLVLVAGGSAATPVSLPFTVMMFFGICVFLASLLQVLLMLVRSGMLVLLAGTLPLSAAMTSTEMGRTWFKKHCGWLMAFIAYKPAAALVYAAAFQMMQYGAMPGGTGLTRLTAGLMMLLLAAFALPALLRLIVPATAAVAGGSVGGAGAGLGALASGARSVSGFGGGASGRHGGGGGGGGGGGPTGSGGGSATGAIGVGGAGAVGAMASVGSKAAGALSDAVSHSAGEAGGGSGGSGGGQGGPRGSGGGRKSGKQNGGRPPAPPKDEGPSGSGKS
jgi:hypothetical protein